MTRSRRAGQRCWKYDWVIDLDVQKFFDTVPWHLVVKAVEDSHRLPLGSSVREKVARRPACRCPVGTLMERDKGTPQGSAASPILANLFMHFAFDNWMARRFPDCPWERYADDAVVHCPHPASSGGGASSPLAERMEQVGLRLHPDKDVDRLLQRRSAPGLPT